jgi:AAA+ ATPase superfamily predicted ATPase
VDEMFFGRKNELDSLEHQYRAKKFEFPVIYGRRRVGKTQLITHFIKDKKAIYFQGIIGTEKQNLDNLAKSYLEVIDTKGVKNANYISFQQLFEDLTQVIKHEKLILVLDEFPYLAQSYSSISSLLQYFIDQYWKSENFMLILCGSSMSFIEHQVLGYQSPLYGRDITRYKLLPFTFSETKSFLATSNEDTLLYYSVTGGVPFYLSYLQPHLGFKKNIEKLFLNKRGKLLEEPLNLLNMEVKDSASYVGILTAIATGSSKHNEIVTKSGLKPSLTTKMLGNLIELGIVERVLPMFSTNNKQAIYHIKDSLYRFWFTFIANNIAYIETQRATVAWVLIERGINKYISIEFEKVCRDWLMTQNNAGKLPAFFLEIGAWWGVNAQTKMMDEIDIVASGVDKDDLLLGECKYKNEKTSESVLKKLEERSQLFSHRNKYLYVFSKSAFTKEAIAKAQNDDIRLVEFSKMY